MARNQPTISLLLLYCFAIAAPWNFDGNRTIIDGNYPIGMLLPIHKPPDRETTLLNNSQARICTEIWDTYGIQRAEIALKTVKEINERNLLKNITLGIIILDECWYPAVALYQTMKMILNPGRRLLAVIGPGSSAITMQVQSLLEPFGISQVGYSATSVDLDDTDKYKYFTRVVPSDKYQVQAMLDIIEKMQWTRLSIVYTKGNYGRPAVKLFQQLIADNNDIYVDHYKDISSDDKQAKFDHIVKKYQSKGTKVVVCFCEGETVKKLLEAVKKLKLRKNLETNPFVFIGSDGWADREEVVSGVEREAVGSISLRIYSPPIEDFDNYFNSLTPDTTDNYWFKDYWKNHSGCKFNCSNSNSNTQFKQDAKLSLVAKAIYKVTWALHTAINEKTLKCNSTPQGKQCNQFSRDLFNKYLMNDSYVGNDDAPFHEKTTPIAAYEILSYQKIDQTYKYVKLGEWNDSNTTSRLSIKLDLYPNKIQSEYAPLVSAMWKEPPGIFCLTSMAIGCLTLSFTLAVFLWYRNTPVVKSSARELSYIMLVGMIMNQASVATLLIEPTQITCAIARSIPLISFTMLLGAILGKTNMIYRLLANQKKLFPKQKHRFMSAGALVIFTWLLVFVEILVCAGQFLVEPLKVGIVYHDGYKRLECIVSKNSVLWPLLFNIGVLLGCVYYAFKTRNVPANFNEAKYVGFGMYTVCVIWLSTLTIYMTNSSIILISRAFCITLSNWALWIFIFACKLYVILFRPEKNTRDYFTTADNIRFHFGGIPAPRTPIFSTARHSDTNGTDR